MKLRFFVVLIALCACATGTPAWPAANAPVTEHALANGMRVLVKPDHRAPVMVCMVWYKVGSMDEVPGNTGLAHVLEHMMFKGTKAVPAGEFSRTIAEAGGRENAFTGRDATGYHETLHKSQLELAMKLEADRMANLALSPEEFSKEIRVVMEERRWRVDDQPRSLLFEQLSAAAFKAHPYRSPTVGWMSDLENMRVEDARAFYERWYAPNNATLVVVGDVQPVEVVKLAEKYFGRIQRKTLPVRKPLDEPPQLGMQQLVVKAPAELPYVLMAYHAPAVRNVEKEWEPYALEMLANVLDGNEAARLNRNLVRTQRIAQSVEASYDSIGRGPGMFYLGGTPTPGKTAQEVEQALKREIAEIVANGVTDEELERVKAQVVAAHVYGRDSMASQAREMGTLEIAGLPQTMIEQFIENLKTVTKEQVQAVAKKYIVDDALTVAYLDPQPVEGRKPAQRPAGVHHEQ